jgi:hypothetical protein
MEKEAPDLFDLKFVRDELFYYSRDENQYLRRRRAFVFVLFPDLIEARFKDPESKHQRIVMIQSAILALIHRLSEWLSNDALRFEVLFVEKEEKKPLLQEETLMKLLLRKEIERGDGKVQWFPNPGAVKSHLNDLARHVQVHCLLATTDSKLKLEMDNVSITKIVCNSATPYLGHGAEEVVHELKGEDAFDKWLNAVLEILGIWI